MQQNIRSFLILAVLVGTPFAVVAQPTSTKRPLVFYDRMERDMFSMLGRTVIQEELEISVNQYERYLQASRADADDPYHKLNPKEQRKKWPEWIDRLNKTAEKILEPEQFQRLQQIQLQQRGVIIFQDPEIAAKLMLTEEQLDEIYPILTDLAGRIMSLLPIREPNGEVRDGHAKERAEAHQVADEKIHAILTKAQNQKWSEMLGPEFKKQIWGKPVYVD